MAILEGGYSTKNIAECGEAVIRILNGEELPLEEGGKTQLEMQMDAADHHPEADRVVQVVGKAHAKYWTSLDEMRARSRKGTEETGSE